MAPIIEASVHYLLQKRSALDTRSDKGRRVIRHLASRLFLCVLSTLMRSSRPNSDKVMPYASHDTNRVEVGGATSYYCLFCFLSRISECGPRLLASGFITGMTRASGLREEPHNHHAIPATCDLWDSTIVRVLRPRGPSSRSYIIA